MNNKSIRKMIPILFCLIVVIIITVLSAFVFKSKVIPHIKGIEPSAVEDYKLEKTVTDYLIDQHSDEDAECETAAISIIHNESTDDSDIYYAIVRLSRYCFEQDCFVNYSGFLNPAVITLDKAEGKLIVRSVEYPQDGSMYGPSMKKLFPKNIRGYFENISEANKELLRKKCEKQASEYLKSIGRSDIKICEWDEVDRISFTDIGMPLEVQDKYFCGAPKFQEYYQYIGTKEVVEDNIRFIYRTTYDKENNALVFTKEDFEKRNIIKKVVVDCNTGKIIGLNDYNDKFMSKFSAYLNLDDEEIKVLFYKLSEDTNSFILTDGKIDNAAVEKDILSYNTATAEEMKDILSVYEYIPSDEITVQPISAVHSSYLWDINTEFDRHMEYDIRLSLGLE